MEWNYENSVSLENIFYRFWEFAKKNYEVNDLQITLKSLVILNSVIFRFLVPKMTSNKYSCKLFNLISAKSTERDWDSATWCYAQKKRDPHSKEISHSENTLLMCVYQMRDGNKICIS